MLTLTVITEAGYIRIHKALLSIHTYSMAKRLPKHSV